jgi:hypothetical protein
MTTNTFTFSKEQKSIIWSTKIAPAKGTEQDANAFFMVCEEYNLNPLLGDITFQRFETKYGPRVSYLISRDALMKHAMRQDDFHNLLSGVVKEGDLFELDAVEGVPIHKFGPKRGKIIGSWSVVKTKTRGNTLVFADFAEYHAALSGKNPVWNSMPSAMIEKVAQSMALKRTFPLGVVFVVEDELAGVETPNVNQTSDLPKESLADELKNAREQKETKKEEKPKKQTAAKTEKPVKEPVKPIVEEKQSEVEQPKTEVKPVTEITPVAEEPTTAPVQEEIQEQVPLVEEPVQEDAPSENVLEYVGGVLGQSGQSQTPYLRLQFKQGDALVEAYAKGQEKIALFDEYLPGTKFTADIESINGFVFVKSAQAIAV